MLANTIHGLSQVYLRRLFLSCVSPKILYTCPAWWNITKVQAKPLEKVQQNGLKLICAAFRTTPTAALEVEASIPPLKHQVNLITRRYAIQLHKLSESSAVVQHLPAQWWNNTPPQTPPPIPITPALRRKPPHIPQK